MASFVAKRLPAAAGWASLRLSGLAGPNSTSVSTSSFMRQATTADIRVTESRQASSSAFDLVSSKDPTTYSKRVGHYNKEIKRLRKLFAEEIKESSALTQAVGSNDDELSAAARDAKKAAKKVKAARNIVASEKRAEQLKAYYAQKQEIDAMRAAAMQQAIEKRKFASRGMLIEESRQWISPEDIDAEIATALEHPIPWERLKFQTYTTRP